MQSFDSEEFEDVIVDAEIVPDDPPGQKRIPAGAVLDGDGLPPGRNGVSRRLNRTVPSDRPRYRGYSPLRGSLLGRGPTLTGPDPMPGRTPPTRS